MTIDLINKKSWNLYDFYWLRAELTDDQKMTYEVTLTKTGVLEDIITVKHVPETQLNATGAFLEMCIGFIEGSILVMG